MFFKFRTVGVDDYVYLNYNYIFLASVVGYEETPLVFIGDLSPAVGNKKGLFSKVCETCQSSLVQHGGLWGNPSYYERSLLLGDPCPARG